MNEMNILFSLDNPKQEYKEIEISVENELENNLDYKFLVGLEGTWTTLKKSSNESVAMWKPEVDGKYSIMVQAKRKESNKPFDFMSKTDYMVGEAYVKLINDIYINKMEIMVGEKITLTVDALKVPIMYRYWVYEKDNWQLVSGLFTRKYNDMDLEVLWREKFLVECKNLNSENMFDDSMKIGFTVQAIQSLEIMNFKCLTENILEGTEIVFEVEAKYEDNRMLLYKFVKIDFWGNSSCIQDYSTKKLVSYVETNSGDYKLLCMAKDMFSLKQFDDRALIYYRVDPYEEIKIHSFTSDLSSPQLLDTPIILKCIVRGGIELLYKFDISGKCLEDSGYIKENSYIWTPKEAGEYKVDLSVKDVSFKGEYEQNESLNFKIEDK